MRWLIVTILAATVALGVMGCSCGYVEDAKQTIFQETKASTLLVKYRWFKNASASLDSKKADIEVFDKKVSRANDLMAKVPATSTAYRSAVENVNLWEQELAGLKASYNDLASEYNAKMADLSYAFCNRGQMPQGLENEEPLPRSYRAYVTN